jgi:glycosyltransferase involved in cell wall biosynthesis
VVLDALRKCFDVTLATPEGSPADGARFDVVHVFRLAAVGLAKPWLRSARQRHLDLDDIESNTHRRIEALSRANGHTEIADWALAERRRYELLEVAAFRSFDRIYVCSEADRASLIPRCKAELVVLPNVVSLPTPPVPTPRNDPAEPFRFLFVGTMDYYPNSDGYQWFCREVLPILQRIAPGPFQVDVAGVGSDGRLRGHPLVRRVGAVPDVRPLYEAAHAAIVPLRAGGGTRIKILEAFSYGRPVVSTTIGAEGISATSGIDILLGDTAADFAARCADLMKDPDLARRLAGNASRLVMSSYAAHVLKQVVCPPPEASIP